MAAACCGVERGSAFYPPALTRATTRLSLIHI